MSIDLDWMLALPAFSAVENIPGFRPLFDSLRAVEDFTQIAHRATLLFAETAHGVNQDYNGMEDGSEFILGLSGFNPPPRSRSFYQAVAIAHNDVLKVPDLAEIWRSSPLSMMGDIESELLGAEAESIAELERRILLLEEPAKEEENVRERWQMWELQQLLYEAYENMGIGQGAVAIAPNFAGALPVESPSNMGLVVDGLSRITQLFLSFFGGAILPGGAVPAIIQATNSIVLKFFEVGSTSLVNTVVAGILRTVDLPAIYSLTTTFAGVWAFLMAYAPLIILAAICAIAVIQNSRRLKVGGQLSVFAGLPGNPSAFVFGGLSNPTRETMKKALVELATALAEEVNTTPVMGFVHDERDRLAMALNLDNLQEPIELLGQTMEAAAIPYQQQLGSNFENWWNS